jgi:hypothetical protein
MGPVTGPAGLVGSPDEMSPHRIQVEIGDQLAPVGLLGHKLALEAPAKEGPIPFVSTIDALCVDPIEMPHCSREVAQLRTHEEVVVVWHQ